MTTSPAVNLPEVATIEFNGTQLITIKKDDIQFAAMRPISDGIGLNWQKQAEKLQRDKDKFNCTLMGTVAADGKKREMLCMPITKLNGWLFSINPNKIPNLQIREKVISYQEECFIALYDYWHKGKAERTAPETLTPSEQHEITQAVKLKAESNGKAIPEIWSRIKNKFQVAKYSQIQREHFQDVIDYISSMETKTALKAEEIKQPEPEQLTQEERNAIMDDIYDSIGQIRESADRLVSFYGDMHKNLNKIGNMISILNAVDYKERRIRELKAGR